MEAGRWTLDLETTSDSALTDISMDMLRCSVEKLAPRQICPCGSRTFDAPALSRGKKLSSHRAIQ